MKQTHLKAHPVRTDCDDCCLPRLCPGPGRVVSAECSGTHRMSCRACCESCLDYSVTAWIGACRGALACGAPKTARQVPVWRKPSTEQSVINWRPCAGFDAGFDAEQRFLDGIATSADRLRDKDKVRAVRNSITPTVNIKVSLQVPTNPPQKSVRISRLLLLQIRDNTAKQEQGILSFELV